MPRPRAAPCWCTAAAARTGAGMATTYGKTTQGVTEIETRAFRLPPRLRSTLILLDGKRTLDELRALVGPGLEENVQVLLDGGFIDAVELPEPQRPALPAAAAASAARAAPPATTSADFLAVRREAVRSVNEQLGPVAETVAIRMERATSAADLRPLLVTAAQLIQTVRGAQAAQAFRARFMAE